MRLLPYGERAVLVELAGLDETLRLTAAVRAADLPGVVDVVPAERTVLVTTTGDLAELRRQLAGLSLDEVPAEPAEHDVVELAVRYDGADLEDVARLTGLEPAEVVRAHTSGRWRVGFGGFMPGFAYLVGGDERLQVPRRNEPRARVPAGAVGLAGSYSGVYPRESPGGWQLIGRTDAALWDTDRNPPALLRPGGWVRFVDAGVDADRIADAVRGAAPTSDGRDRADQPRPRPQHAGGTGQRRALQILSTGPGVLVQDLGRPGLAHLGVSGSGAADRGAHTLAQRLVANDEDAAGLEVLLGGLSAQALGDVLVAVTGAPVPLSVDSRPAPLAAPVHLRDGQRLELGRPWRGLRSYVAVRGGLDVPAVLGSRSSDVLTGLGPAAVRTGDVLGTGPPPRDWPLVDAAPYPAPRRATRWPGAPAAGAEPGDEVVTLAATPGPRTDRLAHAEGLWDQTWTVSPDSDRVGLRLQGRPVATTDEQLPSEGLVPGAVQMPPGGQPVVFLVDHPVTGGYPVVAVVRDTGTLAQLRPGQPVRLQRET